MSIPAVDKKFINNLAKIYICYNSSCSSIYRVIIIDINFMDPEMQNGGDQPMEGAPEAPATPEAPVAPEMPTEEAPSTPEESSEGDEATPEEPVEM